MWLVIGVIPLVPPAGRTTASAPANTSGSAQRPETPAVRSGGGGTGRDTCGRGGMTGGAGCQLGRPRIAWLAGAAWLIGGCGGPDSAAPGGLGIGPGSGASGEPEPDHCPDGAGPGRGRGTEALPESPGPGLLPPPARPAPCPVPAPAPAEDEPPPASAASPICSAPGLGAGEYASTEPGNSGSSGSASSGRNLRRTSASGIRRSGSFIISAEITSPIGPPTCTRGTWSCTTAVTVFTGSPSTS